MQMIEDSLGSTMHNDPLGTFASECNFSSYPTPVPSSYPTAPIDDPLPSLPIMATTRLQLDLLMNDSVIDLKCVAEVVLADAGATLQILRLVGEDFPNEDERPKRIEDCIVSLSFDRCYRSICGSGSSHSGPHVAEWQRCRRLAECTRELARSLEGFPPEEAYLVGLLYRLGTFPQLLGWKGDLSASGEADALGMMLACHWNLPQCVLSAIREQQDMDRPSKWRNILGLAHQLVEQPEQPAAV